ncbi:MAG TPA: hypothetical protein DDZ83_02790 [Nitrospinae bacterium]|nr:hypothetical protein [Nitrospinota bacterium]
MDWYAVQTKSHHERVVRDNLMRMYYSVFLPEKLFWSRRRDRRKEILTPLFPGYLFVAPGENERWARDVVTTRSVVRILGQGGHPMPVFRNEVESLRILLESGKPVSPVSYAGSGDTVRIEDGPLTGAEGVVIRMSRKEHLVVSVALMHRSVAVELVNSQVMKIS